MASDLDDGTTGTKVVLMAPEKITFTSSGDDSGVTFKISGILPMEQLKMIPVL